jgi:hypothetical protein
MDVTTTFPPKKKKLFLSFGWNLISRRKTKRKKNTVRRGAKFVVVGCRTFFFIHLISPNQFPLGCRPHFARKKPSLQFYGLCITGFVEKSAEEILVEENEGRRIKDPNFGLCQLSDKAFGKI